MPTPSLGSIHGTATAAFASMGLLGQRAPGLATALAGTVAWALAQFASRTMVLPGIAASVDPLTGSGATTGPGLLLPGGTAGPTAGEIEGIAQGALSGEAIRGAESPAVAQLYARTLADGLSAFTTSVQAAPGIAAAGFVTTSPGLLLGPSPSPSMLRGVATGHATAAGLAGANAPDLAGAVAITVATALRELAELVIIAPGIAVSPAATTSPGLFL